LEHCLEGKRENYQVCSVPDMTYNVFSGMLNPIQSISQSIVTANEDVSNGHIL